MANRAKRDAVILCAAIGVTLLACGCNGSRHVMPADELELCRQELKDVKADLLVYRKVVWEGEDEFDALDKQLADLRTSSAAQVRAAQDKAARARDEGKKLQVQIASLKRDLATAERQAKSAKDQLAQLKQRSAAEKKATASQIKLLDGKLEDRDSRISQLQGKLGDLEKMLKQLREELRKAGKTPAP